jgi:hypothetical protein
MNWNTVFGRWTQFQASWQARWVSPNDVHESVSSGKRAELASQAARSLGEAWEDGGRPGAHLGPGVRTYRLKSSL